MSLSSSATAAANPWLLVLESLEKKINKHSYDTWLKPTRFSHAKGKVLFISVPTAEFKLIGEKYADLMDHPERVQEILAAGAERIRPIAEATMDEVRHKMGLR
jgi:chromosomal replication initiation ATPase DnaA